ncbi:MAG TPA: TIGR03905 family TSCPD domain-containing protein [Clostridiales bacterium]|nr:TIGR03905 family TSCPD domain-containing protein [Clostridiales bacterium]
MKKHIEYKTHGTCSRMITVDIEDGVITDCAFLGGCPGNTVGVASLVKGMRVEDAIARLSGIRCGSKNTSCPDQLANALKSALEEA